jgi:hypothetical protein
MRMLTNEELALVAGGNGSSDAYDNDGLGGNWYGYGTYGGGGGGSGGSGGFWYWTFNQSTPTYYDSTGAIVVTGSSGYWSYLDFSGGYSGAGIGGGGATAPTGPVAHVTSCVETSFASGADLQSANNAALEASNAIAALNDENQEYSSIVWQMNGTIGWTAPYTNGSYGNVNLMGGLSQVPAGAVIIGIVHNHPDDATTPDTIPSGSGSYGGQDWTAYDQIVALTNLPNGISVDPNMLLYIYSNEDHKTHVYDKTDKSETTTSCSLQ